MKNIVLCRILQITVMKMVFTNTAVTSYSPLAEVDRRSFFASYSTAAAGWFIGAQVAEASVDVKVTPIAHTFITSSSSVKPLRENDATRFLTNAKVAFMLEGDNAEKDLASVVLQLTTKRKAEQGPGVTAGNIHVVSSSEKIIEIGKSLGITTESPRAIDAPTIASLASKLANGDTLLVGPIFSQGTGTDGKIVAETAKLLGVGVGGAKSGGVLSILLDGPKTVELEQDGLPLSTILWYSIA